MTHDYNYISAWGKKVPKGIPAFYKAKAFTCKANQLNDSFGYMAGLQPDLSGKWKLSLQSFPALHAFFPSKGGCHSWTNLLKEHETYQSFLLLSCLEDNYRRVEGRERTRKQNRQLTLIVLELIDKNSTEQNKFIFRYRNEIASSASLSLEIRYTNSGHLIHAASLHSSHSLTRHYKVNKRWSIAYIWERCLK